MHIRCTRYSHSTNDNILSATFSLVSLVLNSTGSFLLGLLTDTTLQLLNMSNLIFKVCSIIN